MLIPVDQMGRAPRVHSDENSKSRIVPLINPKMMTRTGVMMMMRRLVDTYFHYKVYVRNVWSILSPQVET